MAKFSLILDSIVTSTTASSSAQENTTLRAKQEEKTQAVVYNNHESYNYSKYNNSFINLYINAADEKRFLNTLKDEDKDSSLQFIISWHRLLISDKKRDFWADKQLEGIETITQYFYDHLETDPSNSKEWFRLSEQLKKVY